MTELNDSPEAGAELDHAELDHAELDDAQLDHADQDQVGLDADWPAGIARTGDPVVDSVLVRLEEVPSHPVAEHSEVYAGLHDALLEALNAEPGSPAGAIASATRTGGPGASGPETRSPETRSPETRSPESGGA